MANRFLHTLVASVVLSTSIACGASSPSFDDASTDSAIDSSVESGSNDAGVDVAWLESLRTQHNVPGAVAAVWDSDRLIASYVVGIRANGHEESVQWSDRFHLGSDTKAMTATLAARMIEQNQLQWTSSVGSLLPLLAPEGNAYRTLTFLDLVQQRTGISPSSTQTGELWGTVLTDPSKTLVERRRDYLSRVLMLAPQINPGASFEYANANFVLAGHALETRMNVPWEMLMQSELFEPLGMDECGFGAPGRAGAYDQPRGHSESGQPIVPGPDADNPAAIGPAGTVHCSMPSWGKFLQAHLRGGRGIDGYVSAPTFSKMHEAPSGSEYAAGWVRLQQSWTNGYALMHTGSNTLWMANVWVVPGRNRVFAVVLNKANFDFSDAVIVGLAERHLD